MTKLDIRRFSGDDVKGWLFRCEQFFKVDNIQDEYKVQMASMHLYDKGSVMAYSVYEKQGRSYFLGRVCP